MILYQHSNKLYIHVERSKVNYGCRHRGHEKEGTATELLYLWTSSIDELFFIELRLSTAKVWHIEQSWTEATELSNFTRGKMDLQQHLSSAVVSSREHLEFYKDKLVDARGLSHH